MDNRKTCLDVLNHTFTMHKASKIMVVLTFLVLYHVVFRIDLMCQLESDTTDCAWYMVIPFLTIFLVIILVDRDWQDFRLMENVVLFSDAVCIALLWVSCLLLDGDWYVCCRYGLTREYPSLPCRIQKDVSVEDRAFISELRNWSAMYGLMLVMGGFTVMLIVPCCCHYIGCTGEQTSVSDELADFFGKPSDSSGKLEVSSEKHTCLPSKHTDNPDSKPAESIAVLLNI